MTLILEFKHLHSIVRSVAIFNLDQPQQYVMIMPYTNKTELGNTIIFARKNNTWIPDLMNLEYYSTYENMLTEINAVINKHNAFAEVFLQQFLS